MEPRAGFEPARSAWKADMLAADISEAWLRRRESNSRDGLMRPAGRPLLPAMLVDPQGIEP